MWRSLHYHLRCPEWRVVHDPNKSEIYKFVYIVMPKLGVKIGESVDAKFFSGGFGYSKMHVILR
jgi:hypothetical protein